MKTRRFTNILFLRDHWSVPGFLARFDQSALTKGANECLHKFVGRFLKDRVGFHA